MLMKEYARKNGKQFTDLELYAGMMLERLGFIFLIDFSWSNAVDKATEQNIAYLEYAHEREQRGY